MRIEQLTFTRFLAALAIVVFHYGGEVAPFNREAIAPLFQKANVGVSYFFILSGFVMMVAYRQKTHISPAEYYRNRLARIYPVYLSGLLLVVLYNLLEGLPFECQDLFLGIGLLQAWVPESAMSLNVPGWSLSVEALFYLVFPLLFNLIYASKPGLWKVALPALLIFAGSQLFLHWFTHSAHYKGYPSESHNFIYYFPLVHLNEFLVGNLAGMLFVAQKEKAFRNYDGLLLALLVMLFFALKRRLGLNFHNGLLAPLLVPFILLLSLNRGFITTLFQNRILIFLGEISFGIYILQFPVFAFAGKWAANLHITSKPAVFWSALLLLIAVSAGSYHYFERPLRKWLRQR